MRTRRTLAAYKELYADPTLLGEGEQKPYVVLFPHGQRELWCTTADRPGEDGFRVTFSAGPYGLSVYVRPFVGTPELTVTDTGAGEVGVCQYRTDPEAQAFKRWYVGEETEADIELLGPSYRRKRTRTYVTKEQAVQAARDQTRATGRQHIPFKLETGEWDIYELRDT